MHQHKLAISVAHPPLVKLCQLDSKAEQVFLALFCHADVMRYIQPPLTPVAAKQRFKLLLASLQPSTNTAFVAEYFLVEHYSKQAMGIAMLRPGTEPTEAELGRMLLPKWQGQGLGSIVSQLLITKAKERPQLQSLIKRIHCDNLAAIRSAIKLGFRPAATLPNDFIHFRLQLPISGHENITA